MLGEMEHSLAGHLRASVIEALDLDEGGEVEIVIAGLHRFEIRTFRAEVVAIRLKRCL